MGKQLDLEIKVGAFVFVGVILTMAAIFVLGSTENLLDRKTRFFIHFAAVDGLIPGAKVVVGGVPVGTVEQIRFDKDKRDVRIQLGIVKENAEFIRQGSIAELVTQGVLGDKYVTIDSGDQAQPALPEGSEIPIRTGGGLNAFLSKGDQLMGTLNSIAGSLDHVMKAFDRGNRTEVFFTGLANTAKELSGVSEKLNKGLEDGKFKRAIASLDDILDKINSGTGTLGALVNDPGLYDDTKALLGGANRNKIMRNLVRQTIKNAPADNNAPGARDPGTEVPSPQK